MMWFLGNEVLHQSTGTSTPSTMGRSQQPVAASHLDSCHFSFAAEARLIICQPRVPLRQYVTPAAVRYQQLFTKPYFG